MKSIGVLGLLAACTVAHADSYFFFPVADATIYQGPAGGPYLANGMGQYLFVGNNNTGSTRRALLKFDVSLIPAGSVITGVEFTLNVTQAQAGPQPGTIHRLTTAWNEGPSIAGGNEGGGTAALTGDVTWYHTSFATSLWTTPGGDFVATPSASFSIDDLGSYTISSSAQLIADVQAWLDGSAPNHGWIFRGNESGFGTAKRFNSSQISDNESMVQLEVFFDPPGSCAPCVADFNDSGGTPDDADVAAFFEAWSNGDACADANASGGTPDDADVALFFELWSNGGC